MNKLFKNISKEIITEATYSAFWGFSTMGWEVVFYEGNPPTGLSREDVVLGWITQVKMAISNLGIEPPSEIDYPKELEKYLGRKIWKSTLHKIYTDPTTWPVFVKPVKGKQFNGKLITKLGDMIGIGSQEDRDIWCSEPIDFKSEYRCFVRYDTILDCRRYKGDMKIFPDFIRIELFKSEFKNPPAAYTLDVGVTVDANGKQNTYIVEINDGYAMGAYGLSGLDYAKMISARWSEIVGIPDQTRF